MPVGRSKSNDMFIDVNPLKSDPELVGLLKRLDKIGKYKTFNRWKDKFLTRFDSLVFEQGMEPAEKRCNDFTTVLKKTVKFADKVAGHNERGELSPQKKSVKASLALSELANHLTTTVEQLDQLIPSTGKDEKKMGFTKFHLGAVLIRQGFHQYITMKAIEDAIIGIKEKIADVADKQQLELFAMYEKKFQRFCDIMADLNLYEIMMKCVQFAEAPDVEESSDEEPMVIEIAVINMDGDKGRPSMKSIKLEVTPSETIGNIKKMIADDIGIEPDKQVIKFDDNELGDNDASLDSCGVKDGAHLTVEPLKIPIKVQTYDGKTIDLLIDPTSTYISDIKRMLEPECGIPPSNQTLYNKDADDKELDDDHSKACDNDIQAGTTLYLEPKTMSVNITMPDGTKHTLDDISPNDTAADLKKKIEDQTGMSAPEQILKHDGKDISDDDDNTKLKDLGIKHGDDIEVDVKKVPLIVKTKDGETVEIMIQPSIDTLDDIKKQLQDKVGKWVYNAGNLWDTADPDSTPYANDDETNKKTASELGIKPGTTLMLAPKGLKVSIELPDGTSHTVTIDAADAAGSISEKIAQASEQLSKIMIVSEGKLEIDTKQVFES